MKNGKRILSLILVCIRAGGRQRKLRERSFLAF